MADDKLDRVRRAVRTMKKYLPPRVRSVKVPLPTAAPSPGCPPSQCPPQSCPPPGPCGPWRR